MVQILPRIFLFSRVVLVKNHFSLHSFRTRWLFPTDAIDFAVFFDTWLPGFPPQKLPLFFGDIYDWNRLTKWSENRIEFSSEIPAKIVFALIFRTACGTHLKQSICILNRYCHMFCTVYIDIPTTSAIPIILNSQVVPYSNCDYNIQLIYKVTYDI